MDKYELQKEFKNKIDDAFHSIQKLENRKAEVSGKAKEELEDKIRSLEARKDKMDSLYEELLSGSDEKADHVKTKLEKSMGHFNQGIKEITELF